MAILVNETSSGGRGDLFVYGDISNEADRGHYQRGSTEKHIADTTNCDRLSQLLQPSTPNAGYATLCAVRSRATISINVMPSSRPNRCTGVEGSMLMPDQFFIWHWQKFDIIRKAMPRASFQTSRI